MEIIKNILNKISFKLIQYPFFTSILSTIILLLLMQFTIPFDLMLLALNFVLVYWAIKCKYMVIE